MSDAADAAEPDDGSFGGLQDTPARELVFAALASLVAPKTATGLRPLTDYKFLHTKETDPKVRDTDTRGHLLIQRHPTPAGLS